MTEELVPQRDINHESKHTADNLPVPFKDVFGKLSETTSIPGRAAGYPNGSPTEDPAFWPVRVLNELNYMIVNILQGIPHLSTTDLSHLFSTSYDGLKLGKEPTIAGLTA